MITMEKREHGEYGPKTTVGILRLFRTGFKSYGSSNVSAYGWGISFASYLVDQESGFYQVRNRYLHPFLGRWLSRDPLPNAELSQGNNLYWYVGNNPGSRTDELGLFALGIYGFGPADTFFGFPLANQDVTQIGKDTNGGAEGNVFWRGQLGQIRNYILTEYKANKKKSSAPVPIVLFGYSRGGVTITEIASWILNDKKDLPCVKVYLVGIDPVHVTPGGPTIQVPKGVTDWYAWYQKNGWEFAWDIPGAGVLKVLSLFEFAHINGTPYSGVENKNKIVGRNHKGELVDHASMPAYVNNESEKLAVNKINEFNNRK